MDHQGERPVTATNASSSRSKTRPEGIMVGNWNTVARAALVAAAFAGPGVAKAVTGPAPAGGPAYVLPTAGRETAERQRMYAALRRYLEAREIPAFARKYGMKCSACHLAVPVLNQFGQAFKDNGYRMKNGTDGLRADEA